MVSNSLFSSPFAYDPVHVNAEFFDQLSDHDPQVARFFVNTAPTADAGGPYAVAEGGTVVLSATGSDANGDSLTYAWDLDNNGSFETAGQAPTYTAGDGPASPTVRVQVSDGTATTVDEATVNISNVPPTATFSAPAATFAGFPFTLSLTGASTRPLPTGLPGSSTPSTAGTATGRSERRRRRRARPTSTGALGVGGKIRDKDGGESEYRATVNVSVTFRSLCDLVHEYTSDAKTQDKLCARLDLAGRGAERGGKAGAPAELPQRGRQGAGRRPSFRSGSRDAQAALNAALGTYWWERPRGAPTVISPARSTAIRG